MDDYPEQSPPVEVLCWCPKGQHTFLVEFFDGLPAPKERPVFVCEVCTTGTDPDTLAWLDARDAESEFYGHRDARRGT